MKPGARERLRRFWARQRRGSVLKVGRITLIGLMLNFVQGGGQPLKLGGGAPAPASLLVTMPYVLILLPADTGPPAVKFYL